MYLCYDYVNLRNEKSKARVLSLQVSFCLSVTISLMVLGGWYDNPEVRPERNEAFWSQPPPPSQKKKKRLFVCKLQYKLHSDGKNHLDRQVNLDFNSYNLDETTEQIELEQIELEHLDQQRDNHETWIGEAILSAFIMIIICGCFTRATNCVPNINLNGSYYQNFFFVLLSLN